MTKCHDPVVQGYGTAQQQIYCAQPHVTPADHTAVLPYTGADLAIGLSVSAVLLAIGFLLRRTASRI